MTKFNVTICYNAMWAMCRYLSIYILSFPAAARCDRCWLLWRGVIYLPRVVSAAISKSG